MTASAHLLIAADTETFSYDAAQRLRQTVSVTGQDTLILDFGHVHCISTAVLAELVLLRRKLLTDGCDLRVINMNGQVAALYRLCRLDGVLPGSA